MANITKISDGKYFVRISKGTGKSRIFINETIRGTRKDANTFARKQETLLDQGHSVHAITRTFESYVEYWLKQIKVKKRTRQFYSDVCEYYAKPLNDRKLFAINENHIQQIYDDMLDRDLNPNTVRHLHSTLRAIFNFAIKRKHLAVNPCNFVNVPKKKKTRMIVWNELEAARFLRHCQPAKNGLIFELALESGMRPEEYLALDRQSLSFIYGSVSVNRVVCWEKNGGGHYFEETKSEESRRLIPLSMPLLQRLETHLQSHTNELVFPNAIGTPYTLYNLFNRHLTPIMAEAEVPKLTLYGLRHTCATLLLMAGENPKVVADRLGHSSVKQTLDTYSHVLPHIQSRATDKLNLLLRGGLPVEQDQKFIN